MKRIIKWPLVGVGVIAVVIGGALLAGNFLADQKRGRVVRVDIPALPYNTDPAILPHGKYLFESRGCTECHGNDGAGKVFIDAPDGFFVRAPNITPGGVVNQYTEKDWVAAIRHGLKPDGRPLLIMPTEDYNRISDTDLAALIAYLRQLPASNSPGTEIRLTTLVKTLYGFGVIRDGAEKVDHHLPPAPAVTAAVTPEYGAYVAAMCMGCHGEQFSGGRIPGAPPEWPPAANLTPGEGSIWPRYADAESFRSMMRSGRRPDGSAVSAVMPFSSLGQLTDTDLDAMQLYLRSLPPRAVGNR